MRYTTTMVVAAGVLTLALGVLVTWRAYRASRRTGSRPLLALAAGFALVTAGVVAAGAQWVAGVAGDLPPVGAGVAALGVAAFAYALVAGNGPRGQGG